VRGLVVALAMSGCTLLFDPAGIVPHDAADAAGPQPDLPAPVDDLTALPDVAAVPDLAEPDLQPLPDLLTPDLLPCVPPVFAGFFDMGSPDPLDCNGCGCALDPLNDPATWPLKFTHATPAVGWSESFDGGVLSLSAPMALAGDNDYFQSLGHFYLDGDFDLQVDYQALSLPASTFIQLVVIGPQVDLGGGNLPVGVAETYGAANGLHFALVTDDRSFDLVTGQTAGTLRLRRSSGRLCASATGSDELCNKATGAGRVWVQVSTPIGCAAGCSGTSCCNYRVRLSKLRLLHGRVVSSP
jgi:hypothetical protein